MTEQVQKPKFWVAVKDSGPPLLSAQAGGYVFGPWHAQGRCLPNLAGLCHCWPMPPSSRKDRDGPEPNQKG